MATTSDRGLGRLTLWVRDGEVAAVLSRVPLLQNAFVGRVEGRLRKVQQKGLFIVGRCLVCVCLSV